MMSNGTCSDTGGHFTAESVHSDSTALQRWQQKYPDRKIEPYMCTACDKQFLQAVQLRKHMIKHSRTGDDGGEYPYTCYACQRHFLFITDFRRHLVTHSDDRPHSCLICSRPFKREDDLAKHLKTHGDVRPYRCQECSEQLASSSKLRRHMRTAHGDKFECPPCHAFFTTRSQLRKHRRDQHPGLVYMITSQGPHSQYFLGKT